MSEEIMVPPDKALIPPHVQTITPKAGAKVNIETAGYAVRVIDGGSSDYTLRYGKQSDASGQENSQPLANGEFRVFPFRDAYVEFPASVSTVTDLVLEIWRDPTSVGIAQTNWHPAAPIEAGIVSEIPLQAVAAGAQLLLAEILTEPFADDATAEALLRRQTEFGFLSGSVLGTQTFKLWAAYRLEVLTQGGWIVGANRTSETSQQDDFSTAFEFAALDSGWGNATTGGPTVFHAGRLVIPVTGLRLYLENTAGVSGNYMAQVGFKSR